VEPTDINFKEFLVPSLFYQQSAATSPDFSPRLFVFFLSFLICGAQKNLYQNNVCRKRESFCVCVCVCIVNVQETSKYWAAYGRGTLPGNATYGNGIYLNMSLPAEFFYLPSDKKVSSIPNLMYSVVDSSFGKTPLDSKPIGVLTVFFFGLPLKGYSDTQDPVNRFKQVYSALLFSILFSFTAENGLKNPYFYGEYTRLACRISLDLRNVLHYVSRLNCNQKYSCLHKKKTFPRKTGFKIILGVLWWSQVLIVPEYDTKRHSPAQCSDWKTTTHDGTVWCGVCIVG